MKGGRAGTLVRLKNWLKKSGKEAIIERFCYTDLRTKLRVNCSEVWYGFFVRCTGSAVRSMLAAYTNTPPHVLCTLSFHTESSPSRFTRKTVWKNPYETWSRTAAKFPYVHWHVLPCGRTSLIKNSPDAIFATENISQEIISRLSRCARPTRNTTYNQMRLKIGEIRYFYWFAAYKLRCWIATWLNTLSGSGVNCFRG